MRLLLAALIVVAMAVIALIAYQAIVGYQRWRKEGGKFSWFHRRQEWVSDVLTRGGRIYVVVTKGEQTNTIAALDPVDMNFEIRLAEEKAKAEELAQTLNVHEERR